MRILEGVVLDTFMIGYFDISAMLSILNVRQYA